MMPYPSLVTGEVPGQYPAPDLYSGNLLEDYEFGGIDLNDSSLGHNAVHWRGYSDGSSIWVTKDGDSGYTPFLVTTDTGITEISFSFDQLMRPSVVYVAGGVAKLYWYDSSAPGNVTTVITGAVSPKLTLDDKRKQSSDAGESDIILFYIRAGGLYYRYQRDRYGVEYLLSATVEGVGKRIHRVGLDKNNRMHIEIQLKADS
jgi:hypothetical protein